MPGCRPQPVFERLFARLEIDTAGCWIWTGSTRKAGYGQIWTSVADGPRRLLSTHRAMYELTRGPIPDGMDLDHLCRVPLCMNPDHLEPVTRAENVLRGEGPTAQNARRTHCNEGHELVLVNPTTGQRGCPPCIATRMRAKREAAA